MCNSTNSLQPFGEKSWACVYSYPHQAADFQREMRASGFDAKFLPKSNFVLGI
jgi:hypothetical protein